MTPISIHPAFLRDSEKTKLKNTPGPDAQVWIYTEPGVERKLATVVDPKMIDSRILHSITIPPNALFTARFNKEDAEEERRLREWPDDSKWGPDEFVSVLNDENWQWYFTEPKPTNSLGWGGTWPSRPAKKIADLKEVIQKEVDKQLDNNGHLERIKFQNEMIKKQKKEIKELKEMMMMERKCMQYEVDDAEQEITDLKKEKKEMMGKLVKVQWVIEKIKDVKGYTETGEAIAETFDYIDFPEDEKEEFVATSFTNSVVESSLQEDREFYGEDFHELPETNRDNDGSPRTDIISPSEDRRTRSPTPSPSARRNLAELFDRVENGREQYRLTSFNTPRDVVEEMMDSLSLRQRTSSNPIHYTGEGNPTDPDESRPPRWVQRFNVVDRYEDTTVFPDGPELPWYEARYPTVDEVNAARVIQEHYRSLYVNV